MTKSDREARKRIAAYLRGGEHLSLQEIGVRLGGMPQPTVSTLLKEARQEELYAEVPTYLGAALSSTDEELMFTLQFQSQINRDINSCMKGLGKDTPKVYVYDLKSMGHNDVPVASRVQSFGKVAAPELRRLLIRPIVKTIGVAWGGTIAMVVDEIGREVLLPKKSKPVKVIAMCGEPLADRPTQESSSAIAERLSNSLNGSREHAKTLGITPAYLPSKSHVEGAELIWDYILSTKPYVEVFGTGRLPPSARGRYAEPVAPLCDEMDVFLTSVSIEGGTLGYGPSNLYSSFVIKPEELNKIVFGDIGGIPLPRPSLDHDQNNMLQRVRESWTGVTREHLVRCVARGVSGAHPQNRAPGCILVAVGKEKARTVYQAVVEERLVNHLFLDYECAEALKPLIS